MKLNTLFRHPRHWLLLAVAALLLAEGGVRAFGLVDFPLYEANAQIGYIPERLGPALQAALQERGGQVWPISAGSWALRNELAYMRLNPQVPASVKRIVFVLNTGDFGNTASSWACELTHPRTRSTVALWYFFNKYIHAFEPCGDIPAALKVPDGDLAAELRAFMATHGAKTTFVLYPDKPEAADPALEGRHFAAGEALLQSAGATRVVHVLQDKRWNGGYYKDGIHPTAEGNRVLAGIIFDAVVVP